MIRLGEAEALAELFTVIGKKDYGVALDRLIQGICPFDMSCVFAFRSDRPPILIHDGYSSTIDKRALHSYLRGAYLLDPFYSACISGCPEGLWRMRDLAPDRFYESEFAWSREIHPCISDEAGSLIEELGYIIPLTHDFTATYSLMRNRDGSPFAPKEFQVLRVLSPVIAASLQLHWRFAYAAAAHSHSTHSSAEAIFHHAFGGLLTPAQCAITKLILRGHSNVSIAENLGITEGTVKNHRYNIYRRLEISSQAELFQRFIECLSVVHEPSALGRQAGKMVV